MSKKKSGLKSLVRKAWKLQSEYSRRKDADFKGMVPCITCGTVKHWKEMHAGHFFHGSKQRPISYDDRNIHAQCVSCNTYKGGMRDAYSVRVKNRYGPEVLDELEALKHQGKEMKHLELVVLITSLEMKLSQLEMPEFIYEAT